jgi:hypothetical protein
MYNASFSKALKIPYNASFSKALNIPFIKKYNLGVIFDDKLKFAFYKFVQCTLWNK